VSSSTDEGRSWRVGLLTNEQLGSGADTSNGFGVRYGSVASAVLDLGHYLLAVSVGPHRSKSATPVRLDEHDRA
jgi:hypothetical protein